jgi:hypothetical protein
MFEARVIECAVSLPAIHKAIRAFRLQAGQDLVERVARSRHQCSHLMACVGKHFSDRTMAVTEKRLLFVGEPFDRPKASQPVDDYAKRETHIAHLTVVLRLLRAREQTRGQRTHMR